MKRNANKGAPRIALKQDLTIYNANAVKQRFLDAFGANDVLELDLSQVAEIDTAGIQLLVLAKRESLRQKRSLRIVAHSPAVRDAIDFFDLASYFGDPLLIPARDVA